MIPGSWTLAVDVTITRRKRWHILYDPQGEHVTGSQFLADVLAYMALNGIWVYRLVAGSAVYELEMQRGLQP